MKIKKELTKAELEIMQILWNLEYAFMGEIVDSFKGDDKPAYSTIQTVIKVLENKGYVAHERFGKVNRYYSLIKKEDYGGTILNKTLSAFFNDSPVKLVSYLAESGKLSAKEYEELEKLINNSFK